MAFEPVTPQVPTSIGAIRVTIDEGTEDAVGYTVQVCDANGKTIKHVSGDLVPHLSAEEITAVQTFMAAQRVKAQALVPSA